MSKVKQIDECVIEWQGTSVSLEIPSVGIVPLSRKSSKEIIKEINKKSD